MIRMKIANRMAVSGKTMYFIDMPKGVKLDSIVRLTTTHCSPDWQWDHPGGGGHPDGCFLWLVMAGCGTLREGGRQHTVGLGDCLLMSTQEEKQGRQDVKNPLIVSWAELRLIRATDAQPFTGPFHIKVDRMSFLGELFSRSLHACRQEGLRCESGAGWMQCVLDELFQLASGRSQESGSPHAEAIHALCEEIRLAPQQHQSVRLLASRLHVSPDHFIRIFKQLRGVTPGQFIMSARLEMASSLLLFTRRSVAQIADELGYCDSFHFSKQFKARSGLSPLAYRRAGR